MVISRQREYTADAAGACSYGTRGELANALAKIDRSSARLAVSEAVQHVFIVNPLKAYTESAGAPMSTHPATSLRVARLRARTA